MATFYTDRTSGSAPAKYQAQGVFSDIGTYELSSTAAGSVIQMVKVAKGVTVIDMVLYCDDCGTATADVGITGTDADYFMDGVDIGAATGTGYRMGAGVTTGAVAFPYTFAADGTVDLLTITNSTTGTITLVVYMTADPGDLA